MEDSISVFGLGKLGASSAVALASRGFQVIGVDTREEAVDKVNAGEAPVQETDLQEYIRANRERFRATTSPREAVLNTSLSFIIVPTPSDERGAFSLEYVKSALQGIGKALREKDEYHVVVVTSTVLPGSTRHGLLPVLEAESGKRCGSDFGLCYGPEFIALGSVIHNFLNPDFHLIGEFDSRSGDALERVSRVISQDHAPCQRMSLENAELSKIALNSYVTLKISYANTLADLCERIPGNVDVVSDAIGMDTRIGRKYLTGGLGFGGPCFPRDNKALSFLGETLGADCSLLRQNDAYNQFLNARLANRISGLVKPGARVAILGLAYKPLSHVVEESPGVAVAEHLAKSGYAVAAYDPLAAEEATRALGGQVRIAESMADALEDAEVVVIATPDAAFNAVTVSNILGSRDAARGNVTVIDCWRTLESALSQAAGIDYVPVGQCTEDERATRDMQLLWCESVSKVEKSPAGADSNPSKTHSVAST